jgi:hypothetical protein
VTGRARAVGDGARRDELARQFAAERSAIGVPEPPPDDVLFELDVWTCVLTRTTGHGDPHPDHRIWHASGARA